MPVKNKKSQAVVRGQKAVEVLSHFVCGVCGKWWSVGDADPKRKAWFCPWCGKEQGFLELKRK